MGLGDLVGLAFSALRDRKLRATLTILGIVVGPATIVALIGATQGFSSGITEQFNKLGITTVVVSPATPRVRLTTQDVTAMAAVPHVKQVAPFYRFPVSVELGGNHTLTTTIIAIEPSKLVELFPGFALEEGRVPNDFDLAAAIVGYNFAHPADPEQPALLTGEVVTFGSTVIQFRQPVTVRRALTVAGVAARFGQGIAVNVDDGIFVPLQLGQTLSRSPSFAGIFLVADDVSTATEVADAVQALLGNTVRVLTVTQLITQIQTITAGFEAFLGAIALMSVLVAFIGIMTTMFTAVTERTREIGLLKALGFPDRHVLGIFLAEAGLTGLIGGLIGVTSGAMLSNIVLQAMTTTFRIGAPGGTRVSPGGRGAPPPAQPVPLQFQSVLSFELLGGALLLALIVGLLAGLLPAWRASRLTPVDALRHE